MSAKKEKVEKFEFTPENLKKAREEIKKYPEGRQKSAILALLDLAQRQSGGWLPREAIEYVASFLDVPFIRAYEVATFYTMFNLKPVGENHIQICTTTPCYLRGAGDILATCKKELGVGTKEVTGDGKFSISEVECLGACVNAPVVQIGDFYYEDLTPETMKALIDKFKKGEIPQKGSQTRGKGSSFREGN